MAHLSEDELNDILEAAAKQVVVGGRYRHYKGQTYTVTQLVIMEATDEPAVVYQADYDQRLFFVRALDVWIDQVEYQGRTMPHFELLKD